MKRKQIIVDVSSDSYITNELILELDQLFSDHPPNTLRKTLTDMIFEYLYLDFPSNLHRLKAIIDLLDK